ncbi:hypothetical protein [Arthrobacter sp. ZGTC412]|uniref:hypothetical protein n=1 Tax=Arthrobacter sp. ZGTC412 TaxID=2058900 RepID=UPI0027D29648|nr:hypothetical protein [Arthrobacter sp. ZGTC412]
MLTDRDIVIKCLAASGDPRTATAGEFREGKPVTIGADDSPNSSRSFHFDRHYPGGGLDGLAQLRRRPPPGC